MRFPLIAAGLAILLAGPLSADTLEIVPASANPPGERPDRGMTMERVEAAFGAPRSRSAPVGDPPISRWEYPGFVVFFEHSKVIHAVARATQSPG
jgi:hypothetical protein